MATWSETALGRRWNNEVPGKWRFPFLVLALLLFLALAAVAAEPGPAALDRALALYRQGKVQEALAAYRALLASSDSAVAAEARHNACALENDLGDFKAALPDCREALRLRRASGDPEKLGKALNNLGLSLEMLGNTPEAEASYREALELNRRRGDALGEAINLGNLGALAASTGRYSQALTFHEAAADLALRHPSEPWVAGQLQIASINKGTVLTKLGAYREALDLYRGILGGGLDPAQRAALLVNAGVLYRNLGDPVRASQSFQEAIALNSKLGDKAALSNAWLNLGLAQFLNLAQPEAAERSLREALRLALESGDRTEEVQDLFYLGRLVFSQRRLPEAAELFRRGLEAAEASGAAEGIWSCREGLGRVAAATGDAREALSELDRALEEIEKVRAGIARGARRAGYFGSKRSVYGAAVAVLADLERREPGKGWGERALEVVERAKARDLLDALGASETPAAPRKAAELKQASGETGTTLEYFAGETDLYLWVIRRSGIRMVDLGPAAPLLAAVGRLHHALAHGTDLAAEDLKTLSRALLGPAAPFFPGEEPLRVAADGALRYLPFELLPDPERGAAPAPLLDRLAVVYLPSASALPRESGGRRPALTLAGFGAPILTAPQGTAPRTPRDLLLARFGLAPLPAAAGELAAVAAELGGKREIRTGAAATEGAFWRAVASGARVVHLATHTVIDERPGRGAAILLSPAGEDDGLLSPDEIARHPGRTDLTVLAACRTALGGEGGAADAANSNADSGALASLTGAFLAAGSRGVVATLWDVDDAATAAFMVQFYDRLGRGDPPALALRQAKLRLRADPRWNRPSLWAGYVLVGEPPPVASGRWIWLWLLGLAAAAARVASAALRRRVLRRPAPPGG